MTTVRDAKRYGKECSEEEEPRKDRFSQER